MDLKHIVSVTRTDCDKQLFRDTSEKRTRYFLNTIRYTDGAVTLVEITRAEAKLFALRAGRNGFR
jgi:hypothetical protein